MNKLCKDCKWATEFTKDKGLFAKCVAPRNIRCPPATPQTGFYDIPIWTFKFCSAHRVDGFWASFFNKSCGKKGKWWEAR